MAALPDIGFIGLGTMGAPMALNLLKGGTPLTVWNRSEGPISPLAEAGATVASDPDHLFAQCRTVILMLANEAATDAVLGRGTSDFLTRVNGRTIVAMGTMPPEYSQALGQDIKATGGAYVEAPVSGSRKPAEAGA